jgi:hypothetical protein
MKDKHIRNFNEHNENFDMSSTYEDIENRIIDCLIRINMRDNGRVYPENVFKKAVREYMNMIKKKQRKEKLNQIITNIKLDQDKFI